MNVGDRVQILGQQRKGIIRETRGGHLFLVFLEEYRGKSWYDISQIKIIDKENSNAK